VPFQTASHCSVLCPQQQAPPQLPQLYPLCCWEALSQSTRLVMTQVDTEGRIASDSFFVTYHGEPLNQSMVQLVTNALQVELFWVILSTLLLLEH
jgi:hypothetical protein